MKDRRTHLNETQGAKLQAFEVYEGLSFQNYPKEGVPAQRTLLLVRIQARTSPDIRREQEDVARNNCCYLECLLPASPRALSRPTRRYPLIDKSQFGEQTPLKRCEDVPNTYEMHWRVSRKRCFEILCLVSFLISVKIDLIRAAQ